MGLRLVSPEELADSAALQRACEVEGIDRELARKVLGRLSAEQAQRIHAAARAEAVAEANRAARKRSRR